MAGVTQSQIAKLAGVSRATVGRVINQCDDVNPETRDRILKIVKDLDYRPNLAGQALVIQQKNFRIGCIIIQSDNPFYEQLNVGIEQKAADFKQYGIEVIVRRAPFTAKDQLEQIELLLKENICALAIQPTIDPAICSKLADVEASGIPVVTINTDLPDYHSSFCYVGNDFHLCGKTAANLLQLFTGGKCSIGIVTGFMTAKSHEDRILGFREYIKDFPDMNIAAIEENRDDDMESYYVTRTMLRDHPEIDALFLVAGGVYGAGKAVKNVLKESGRKIMVVSFDDVPTTKQLVREGIITATICQQPERQGSLALSVLFDFLVEGKKPERNRIYTDIQIKVASNIDTEGA